MKKTCLALLAATALPAFATLDIASVDIEGIKLGMKGEEAIPIVKEHCSKAKDEKYFDLSHDIGNVEISEQGCYGYDGLMISLLNNNVISINARQEVSLTDNIMLKEVSNEFRGDWLKSIRTKAWEKYGPPSLEETTITPVTNKEPSMTLEFAICWGECKKETPKHSESRLTTEGKMLIIGFNFDGTAATVNRILQDEASFIEAQKTVPKTTAVEKAAAKVNL